MTEEQRNRLGDYSVRFGLNEYFANSLLPMDIKGIERRVTRTTPRTQADSGIMMLVRSGKEK